MTSALAQLPRVLRVAIVFAAMIIATFLLSFAPASGASASTAHVAAATPTPPAAPQSIGVWIRLASDKSNVAGVEVTVTGDGGFTQTVTTGKDGRAEVPIVKTGTYKVLVVQDSVPKDAGKPRGLNPREVEVQADNQGVPAYFLLSPDAAGGSTSSTPGSSATPGSTPSHAATSSNDDQGMWHDVADAVLPRLATGLIFGLLIALASIGVSLIYGTTGLNNFAHGELVTFGALVGYVASGVFHLPGWIGITLALVLGGVFGYIQDLGLWKPLRRKRVALIPLMIVSIGFSLALRYVFQFAFGPDLLVTPNDSSPFLTLGPVKLRFTDVTSPIICIVMLLLVAFILLRTRIGKATRAVADNGALAASSGIDVERVIRLVWIGGGALAGLSGALIGYYQPVSWQTGASILLLIFASVTLGGLGTAFGALVGSLVIGLLVDLSTIVIPSNMKFVAALLVMIIILIFRPQGILGRKSRIG